jgi:hypothetical protein
MKKGEMLYIIYKLIMDIFIMYIMWIVYIFFESAREANLVYQKSLAKTKMDIKAHVIHNTQKLIFLFLTLMFLSSKIGWLSFPTIISMILILPYIHNNTYFLFREKLDPLTFTKDSCEESDCVRPSFYINCTSRKKLFIIGCLLQIIAIYIKYYLNI